MLKQLIEQKAYQKIDELLASNPTLANEGMPYDEVNAATAHPLHRLADAVWVNKITDKEAVEIACIFLKHRALVNGTDPVIKKDSPLIAACSLKADALAVFYIDNGADIHHQGCHGGTALHWAAWCGRDTVVKRLLEEKPDLNKLCIDFKSTPLFWAIHGYKNAGADNRHQQIACAKLLLEAGADKSIPNIDNRTPLMLLGDEDVELKYLLS